MKKFTLLMAGLMLWGIGFSQTATITKIWDKSIIGSEIVDGEDITPGTVPSYMSAGSEVERGLAFFDGKLFIPSRKDGNKILVVDAQNGELIKSIDLASQSVISGGTFPINDIAITESGNIIICNLSTSAASPFKAYLGELQPDDSYIWSNIVEFAPETRNYPGTDKPFTGTRLGDGLGIFGDISSTDDGYIITGDANSKCVFRFDIVGGTKATDATIIELKDAYFLATGTTFTKLGTSPRFFPITEELFYMDSQSYYPSLYDMQGEIQDKFSGNIKPQTSGISGVYSFQFKGVEFMVAPTTNHVTSPKAAFEVFMIPPSGLVDAKSMGIFPQRGLGTATNASYIAPAVAEVMNDKVILYAMSAKNGICAYEMTVDFTQTSVKKETSVKLELYPNPAKEYIKVRSDVNIANIKVYSIAGTLVRNVSNSSEVSVSGLKGSYIVHVTDTNGNSIKQIVVVQ